MNIGIIGFGRIGAFICERLSEDFFVFVNDKKGFEKEIENSGATAVSLAEVCQQDIIIPCVPISEFEQTIKKISPLLKKDSLVIDVCSVKEYPIEIMNSELPGNVEILASHPMFGPDSAKETLYGAKIVLCPIRISDDRLDNIKNYLSRSGLTIIETSAEKHDRQISHSLLLTHLIGQALIDMKATSLSIDTKGYKRLMKILETVENDSYQLFLDMNKHNKYSKEIRDSFFSSLRKIEKTLA